MAGAAALAATAVLVALAIFQAVLAGGAPLGRYAWGGQQEVLPPGLRVGSAVSIVLYALFALVLLDRAAVTAVMPDGLARVGAWVLVAYFALGIVMNAISRSRPERNTMTPIVLVLAVLSLVVSLS